MTTRKSQSRLSRRRFLKTLGGAAGGLLAAACAPAAPGPAPTEAAGGPLELLGWQGYDLLEIAQPWAEANRVAVNSTTINHNDQVAERVQSSAPGRFDVGNIGSRYLPGLIAAGLVQPLDTARVPNFSAAYPALRQAAWANSAGSQYALPAYFGFDVLNYNADLIDAPQDWAALHDPAHQGKVGLYDSLGVMTFVGILLGHGGDAAVYTHAQLTEIRAWALAWKRNGGALLATYGEMADRLAAGDLWLAAPGWEYVAVRGAQLGAPLRHTLPAGPAKCWADAYILFAEAQHLDAAYGWLDNAFAPEVMAQSGPDLSSFVANPQAVPLLPAEHRAALGYDAVESQLERAEFSFFPPEEQADPDLITLGEMQAAWEEVKAA